MRSPSIHLEIVRDEARFLALEPHWQSLLERSAIRTPFRTWDWTRTWWKHFRDRYQLRVGVLRDAHETPIAIAPFMLGREDTGTRQHLRHLTLVGGLGDVLSEGLDFLIPQGQEQTLIPHFAGLIRQLRSEWDVIDVPMLHEESPSLTSLTSLLASQGAAGSRSTPHPAHVLALPRSWDELLGTFSGNRRSDLRSKWKKLMNNHQGRALDGGRDLPGDAAMEALIGVHKMRFTAAESTFISDRAMAFHREMVQTWMPSGQVMISLLEADGRIAAGRYGFVYGGRYWDYQSGYDDDFRALSVGNLNLGWAVQNAISRGLSEYDHLAGDQAYKQAWSSRTRRLLHLEAFNRASPMSMLFRLIRSIKRAVTGTPREVGNKLSTPSHA